MTNIEQCTNDGIFHCISWVFVCLLSVIVLLFNLICGYKLYKYNNKRITHEMISLFFASLQGLFIFIHSFFIHHYLLVYTAFFLQIVTFSYVNFCFVAFYFDLIGVQANKNAASFIFLFFWGFILIIFILGIIGEPNFDCYNQFGFQWIAYSACSLIISINCLLFGYLLIKFANVKEYEMLKGHSFFSSMIDRNQAFLSEQKKIIIFLTLCFIISSVCNFAFDMIADLELDENDIICDNDENMIAVSKSAKVYMFLRSVFQILPIAILPWGFYYIPIVLGKKIKNSEIDIKFEDNSAIRKLRNEYTKERFDSSLISNNIPNFQSNTNKERLISFENNEITKLPEHNYSLNN